MSATLALVAALAGAPAPAGGLATPVIRAERTGGCPDAAAVSQRLSGLLDGADADGPARDVVELSVSGSDLLLRLSRADGTLVGERRIPRSKRCAELADAVAALVAAWEADLAPAPAPEPPPAPPPAPHFEPVPTVAATVEPPRDHASYELGVLPAVWLGGGHLSFAGTVRAAAWSRRSPVAMTLALSATFPAEGEGAGLTRWSRHAFSGGVMGRLRHDWLFVDGTAEVVLGWLVVNQNGGGGTRAAFDPGLTIGLRAGSRATRHLELYASLAAWGAAWNTGIPGAHAVPHWGLLTGFGGSFLFGPL